MLIGIALLYFRILPAGTVHDLTAVAPFVTALTIAFILFHVGLGIRFEDLSRVLGRALAFTLSVQVTTGIALAMLAWVTFHWDLLLCFVFGFALSGPSSISVPVLVRVARMPKALGTSLLFESVVTDLLQLLVPLILIGLLLSGNFSTVHVGTVLAVNLVGSTVAGVVAAIFWLWVMDRIGPIVREYSWTLTITMVLATYGLSDYLGLSAAITIFVFGLMVGNRRHLEFDPLASPAPADTVSGRTLRALQRGLRLRVEGVDVDHIQQVQKEVSFFASAFFFVYLGLLFQVGGLTTVVLLVPLAATLVILALRYAFAPMLSAYLDGDASARRSQRALLSFNIPRGLAAAVIATVPLADGLVIPGFLDAMFLAILLTTLVSTVGIFLFYSPGARAPVRVPPSARLGIRARPAPPPASPPPPPAREAPPSAPRAARSPASSTAATPVPAAAAAASPPPSAARFRLKPSDGGRSERGLRGRSCAGGSPPRPGPAFRPARAAEASTRWRPVGDRWDPSAPGSIDRPGPSPREGL